MGDEELGRETMTEALLWARTQVDPPLSVAAAARQMGVPRTTYDSWERGVGKLTTDILDRFGAKRGLPKGWYRGRKFREQQLDKNIPKSYRVGSTEALTTVLVPCAGYLTRADLREDMYPAHEPIQVPANMADPSMIVAIAEADDTMPEFAEGTVLLFLPVGRDPRNSPKIGKKVFCKMSDGTSSLRELVWDGDRMVCRALRPGRPDVAKSDVDVQGLLVGWIAADDDEEFHGRFKRSGI
jgi:hypothetical protein